MRSPLVSLTFCLLTLVTLPMTSSYPTFAEYVIKFNKIYSQNELTYRQEIYNANVAAFGKVVNFIPGINQFSDWTEQEVKGLSKLKQQTGDKKSSPMLSAPRLGLPVSIDYRNNNFLTEVKNQRNCGACWAYASAGLIQAYLVKNGKQNITIDLAEQFVLECTPGSNCNGGFIEDGIDKIKTSSPTEAQYPFIGPSRYGGQICSATGTIPTGIKRSTYYGITDSELINLLQQGPVAIGVASQGWSSYNSGIITCSPLNSADHAVIAVGYTPDSIIFKNSWGTTWGMNGYGQLSRDSQRNCQSLTQVHVVRNGGWALTMGTWIMLGVFMSLMI